MQWHLSYTQKCIICVSEGGVNSAAALFSKSTSSQLKLVVNPFFSLTELGCCWRGLSLHSTVFLLRFYWSFVAL